MHQTDNAKIIVCKTSQKNLSLYWNQPIDLHGRLID